jgi:hypothetical protein
MSIRKANIREVASKYKRKSTGGTARKKENALKLLEELKGIGEGVWNEDAQAYVNRLRDNDRF